MGGTTELEQADQLDRIDDDLYHGAHIECQVGAPFVVLSCGIAADWYEQDDTPGREMCQTCWSAEQCPMCGVLLERA